MIGQDPNLSSLEGPGNLKMQYDFRQVYASVLGQWFGAAEDEIAGKALPRHFDQLPIFKVTPSSVDAPGTIAGALQVGQNYPNPAANGTTIPIQGFLPSNGQITLYNTEGRIVLSRQIAAGATSVDLDTRALPSGTYIYELASGSARTSKTMVVRR
jgi:hypothetical protein